MGKYHTSATDLIITNLSTQSIPLCFLKSKKQQQQ